MRIRLWCLILIAVLLTNAGVAEETQHFSWWIARGEDTSYYDDYNQNPVLNYLLNNNLYDGARLSIDFWAGVSGAERENFNNMLATGDMADVMDLMYSDYSPSTLYEDGYILDLTELVEEYMPNYWRLVNENADVADSAWSYVNGEKKLLCFYGYNEYPEPFEGFCYRRDWVAKYGEHPFTGESFEYGYDEDGRWYDDVVFPCGESTPYYISDWEWMFEIFTRAMNELGIEDSYCISVYYAGYMGTGDLYSGFGGGCPWWYRDKNGGAAFGGANDSMRAYLTCLNAWYQNGWLDKSFAERSGDMFYIIDSKSVHQGKVGMWQGRQSEVGAEMDMGTEYTEGIMVYGCPQPINDLYGGDEQMYREPDCYYLFSKTLIGPALSSKAEGKELSALLSFIDWFYTPEGATLASNGFSKEQLDAMDESEPWLQMYKKFGIEDGTYYAVEENGETVRYYNQVDVLLGNAMKLNRMPRGNPDVILHTEIDRPKPLQDAIALWALYPNTAYLYDNVNSLLSTDDSARKAKISSNIQTYMAQTLPKFIMGQRDFDITNDKHWDNYVKVMNKYGFDKVTDMYAQALELMER